MYFQRLAFHYLVIINVIYFIILRCANFIDDRSAALTSLQKIYAALRYDRCATIAALR